MSNAAEAAFLIAAPAALPVPLRAVPVGGPEPDAREELVRRLAADRLRDLRDDGVTAEYVARMYGVDAALVDALQAELLPSPPHAR